MTPSPSQEAVARDAANKCCDWLEPSDDPFLPEEREKCTEIILYAIVKSRAAQPQDDPCKACGAPLGWFEPQLCDKCRAAQPQEWFYEAFDGHHVCRKSENARGLFVLFTCSTEKDAKGAIAAHNASIKTKI